MSYDSKKQKVIEDLVNTWKAICSINQENVKGAKEVLDQISTMKIKYSLDKPDALYIFTNEECVLVYGAKGIELFIGCKCLTISCRIGPFFDELNRKEKVLTYVIDAWNKNE